MNELTTISLKLHLYPTDKQARNHGTHEYPCQHCGYTSNDDRIGAMNIQLLGTNWVMNKETTFNQLQANQE